MDIKEVFELEYLYSAKTKHVLQELHKQGKLKLNKKIDFNTDFYKELSKNSELACIFLFHCQDKIKSYEEFEEYTLKKLPAGGDMLLIQKAYTVYKLSVDPANFMLALKKWANQEMEKRKAQSTT